MMQLFCDSILTDFFFSFTQLHDFSSEDVKPVSVMNYAIKLGELLENKYM